MRAAYFRWLTGALVGASISRLGAAVRAQTTYSREFWPEIDLHHRFADRMTDMIGLVDTSRDRDSGPAYQGELGAVLDHRFLDWFSARIGYRHASALDGGSFREDRLLTEQTFRMALPPRVTIDFRTREDLRWPDTGYSMRFRRVARHRAVLRAPGRSRGLKFRRRCGRADTAHLVLNRAQERKTTFARLLLIAALAALPGVADA
jgi:hypothetical protein